MRRGLAVLLVAALVAAPTAAMSLHVHDYSGHDHPEHHHGPALHEHGHDELAEQDDHGSADRDHGAELENGSCDPGRHATATKLACAHPPRLHLSLAELPSPPISIPAALECSAIPITDVRVHGPPVATRRPARAPPRIHLA